MFQDIITKTTVSNTGNHMKHMKPFYLVVISEPRAVFGTGIFFIFNVKCKSYRSRTFLLGGRLRFTAKIIDVIFLTYNIYIPFDGHSILRPMLFENK